MALATSLVAAAATQASMAAAKWHSAYRFAGIVWPPVGASAMQRSVDALVETISARYSGSGWEVKSTTADSVVVQLPYLVADLDTILEELHSTHGAAADLRLTAGGAELQLWPEPGTVAHDGAARAAPPCRRAALLSLTGLVLAAASFMLYK